MEYKDYYKILGVEKTAGKEEIRTRYRKLARQYHPDVNKTDKDTTARFAEISEAYEVLSDDEKRKKYDMLGQDWERYQNTDQSNQFDWTKYASSGSGGGKQNYRADYRNDFFDGGDDMADDFFGASDFFRTIFGQGFRGRENTFFAQKGQDLHAELSITLEDAFRGGAQILSIDGQNIRLTLKPGIWDRQTIRIAGKGSAGNNGGHNGDLYITFVLQPNADYRIDGTDLYMDLPVSIYAAILGATQEVKTISGTYKIKIPPGTQNGKVFKLKGRGFPVYGKQGVHGDLYLKVSLRVPERLDAREKSLFRELAALRNEKVDDKKD